MSLSAQDIMTKDPISVLPGTALEEASRLMVEHGFNGLPVVDAAGNVLGVICQSDLVRQHQALKLPGVFSLLGGFIPLSAPHKLEQQLERLSATTVGQAMSAPPVCITPDTPLEKIADMMVDQKYYTLPVVQAGRLVGIVGKEDILKTLRR